MIGELARGQRTAPARGEMPETQDFCTRSWPGASFWVGAEALFFLGFSALGLRTSRFDFFWLLAMCISSFYFEEPLLGGA